MKNIAITILVTFGLFGMFYLMGCFVENTFNLALWDIKLRAFIGIIGGSIAIGFGGIYYAESDEK